MLKIQIQNQKNQAGTAINLPDNQEESLELALNQVLVNAQRGDLRIVLQPRNAELPESVSSRLREMRLKLSDLESQVQDQSQTLRVLSLTQTGELSPSGLSKTSSDEGEEPLMEAHNRLSRGEPLCGAVKTLPLRVDASTEQVKDPIVAG